MLHRLEQALEYTARCIAQHGEVYLPLFERLEAEIEAVIAERAAHKATLARALQLASQSAGRVCHDPPRPTDDPVSEVSDRILDIDHDP